MSDALGAGYLSSLSEKLKVDAPTSRSPWMAIGIGASVPTLAGLAIGFGKIFKNTDGTVNTKKSLIVWGLISVVWLAGVGLAYYKNYV